MSGSLTSELASLTGTDSSAEATRSARLNEIYRDIVTELMVCPNAYLFFRPVDPVYDGAPDYLCHVRRQISFYDIQKKLDTSGYEDPEDFRRDVNEVWRNAQVYNGPGHIAHETAVLLAKKSQVLMARLPHFKTQEERTSGLHRYVSLKLERYRAAKRDLM